MNILDVHKKNFDFFKNAIKNGKLHHTYIFHGSSGTGKFRFAYELARYIQCEKEEKDFPCEQCKSCKVSKDGYISGGYILDKGKDEDILKADILEAKRNVELSSQDGKRKFILINNSHNIHHHSRDLLLKTLEEPPINSIIILVTDEKEQLPKTILSRCPAVFFARPGIKKIKQFISTGLSKDDIADFFYLQNFGNINVFFDKERFEEIEKTLIEQGIKDVINELRILLIEKSLFNKMTLVKSIDDGDEVKNKVNSWILILYNLLLAKQENQLINDSNKKIFESLPAGKVGLEKNLEYDKIVRVLTSLFLLLPKLETNASKRLILEDFILQNE